MKKIKFVTRKSSLWAILIILLFPTAILSQIPHETAARKFLDHLIREEVDEMMEMTSNDFRKAVTIEQMEEIASGLEIQLGRFKSVNRVVFETSNDYEIVILVCEFENMELGARIVFDGNMMVGGFQFVMPPPEKYADPPAYADSDLFTEEALFVDCGDIKLPAIFTMPKNHDKVPVIVLVHGSGAHDADETIGPNKIFRDLAWGLASRGIAVLRYEKRTFQHAGTLDIQSMTVWEETGQDAVYAIKTASMQKGVDPDKVYLLGHSLGGLMAPRIAQKATNIKGIISMAGTPRYLFEIIPEQVEYLLKLRNDTSEASLKELTLMKERVESLKDKRLNPGAEYSESFFNMPPSYLKDINKHNIGKIAANLPQRILVLHGKRDYQITMDDFNEWKKALAKHHDSSFIIYPELNHLFFKGEGDTSGPEEYFVENNVDEQVIINISGWILQD